MRSVTVITFLAFVVQAHAQEQTTKNEDNAQDSSDSLVDKMSDKLVDKLVGTSPTSLAANKQTLPILSSRQTPFLRPSLKAQATRNLITQVSPLPSSRQFAQLKQRYIATKHSGSGQVGETETEDLLPQLTQLGKSKKRDLVVARAAAVAADDAGSPKEVDIWGSVFNLLKNIVGLGALSLPAGVAAVGAEKALLAPAVALFIVMGVLSGYAFYSIGRQCGIQGVSTFDEAWAKSIGKDSKWVVTTISLTFCMLGLMGYSIVMGDSFSAMARSGCLGNFLATNPLAGDRRTWILGVTATALFPLCCLQKLGSLAITSLLGTMAIAYTGVFMAFRLFEGSYCAGGGFHCALTASKAALPAFTAAGGGLLEAFQAMVTRSGTFVLLAMSGAAYCAHQNAPIFFDEAGRDLGKFRQIVTRGFGLAIVLNLLFLITGFATFGASAAGNILKNYASTDGLATLANGLYGGSVIATYPLIYVGMKPIIKGVLSKFKSLSVLNTNAALSTLPLALITATACVVSDAGVVNAVCGAICGASLIYILPALMYLKQADKNAIEKVGNQGLLGLGVVMAVLGVYTSLAPR